MQPHDMRTFGVFDYDYYNTSVYVKSMYRAYMQF